MHDLLKDAIPIWFFIGVVLLINGLLVAGSGLYALLNPPETPLLLANLHADLWWGLLMTAVGLYYTLHFRPRRGSHRA